MKIPSPPEATGRTTRTGLDALPPTITVVEAGQLLGISRASAYEAVQNGEIPSLRIGRRLLVKTGPLLDLLGHTSP